VNGVAVHVIEKSFLFIVNVFIYIIHARLIRKFRKIVGYYPNVAAPRKYHERMIWRKIFDHNPFFVTFCDKLATKEYIRSVLPEAVMPKTLWTGVDVAQIPLPLRNEAVVLKANHGSSYNYFGRFGDAEMVGLKNLTEKWLQKNYGASKYEWGYFGARKLLYLEERIVPPAGEKIMDISVRCSHGAAVLCSVAIDNKMKEMKLTYFEVDGSRFRPLEKNNADHSQLPDDFVLPSAFPLAVEYAKRLSLGIDYARYDFLCAGDTIYPGEITVYPGAGMTSADDEGIDDRIVKGWDMTQSWFVNTNHAYIKSIYARIVRKHFDQCVR
jgi:hypothetical protein